MKVTQFLEILYPVSGKSSIFCTSVLQSLIKVLIIRDVGATHLHIDQKKLALSCQRYSNWFTKVNLLLKNNRYCCTQQ